MDYISSNQVRLELLEQESFDLFIVASGYESRCTWLIEHCRITAEKKLALAFTEKSRKLNRKKNNQLLQKNQFEFLESFRR